MIRKRRLDPYSEPMHPDALTDVLDRKNGLRALEEMLARDASPASHMAVF